MHFLAHTVQRVGRYFPSVTFLNLRSPLLGELERSLETENGCPCNRDRFMSSFRPPKWVDGRMLRFRFYSLANRRKAQLNAEQSYFAALLA